MTPSAPFVAHPALAGAAPLTASKRFMTFAGHGPSKHPPAKPLGFAALVAWGIARFEYLRQVPANRSGCTVLSLAQPKILQEVIAIAVFVPVAALCVAEPVELDDLWTAPCPMRAGRLISCG